MAVTYANYLRNRAPTRALKGSTPYRALYGRDPDYSIIHPFGSPCYVLIEPSTSIDKTRAKSTQATFVGLSENTKAYLYILPNGRKAQSSRDVIFPTTHESKSELVTGPKGEKINIPAPATAQPSPPIPTSPTPENPKNIPTSPLPFSTPPPLSPLNFPPSPTLDTPVTPTPVTSTLAPVRLRNELKGLQPSSGFVQSRIPTLTDRATTRRIFSNPDTPSFRPINSPSESNRPNAWRTHTTNHMANAITDPDDLGDMEYAITTLDNDIPTPSSLAEAQASPHWPDWRGGMGDEITNLDNHDTYEVTSLPPDRKAVKSKWVFKYKPAQGGNPARFKARLVAQGFTQIAGIDFDQTHAPSLRLESFRLFLSISASLDLEIHGMDAVGAYLNGNLEHEIYMTQPPYFDDNSGNVWKLKKALYGLRQSGHAWRGTYETELAKLGFYPLNSHPTLFIRHLTHGIELLAIHIDDFALASSITNVNSTKRELGTAFEMNDLGELRAMIGFELTRDRPNRLIHLSQANYVRKIVDRLGLANANTAPTPLDTHTKLMPLPAGESDPSMENAPYQLAIGSLMYLAMGTRPDIAFAVTHLSQFASNPSQAHWTAIKRVFRYIKGSADLRLTLGGITSTDQLIGFSDADWAGNLADRRSISGYLFLLGGPISWSAKKQPIVSLSTMEAEYMALTHATREAIWLRAVLAELGAPQTSPTVLHVDNQATLAFAKNQDLHSRTKHIAIRHFFCCDAVKNGDIDPCYIHTDNNLADIFTKALPAPRHLDLVSRLNLSVGAEGES